MAGRLTKVSVEQSTVDSAGLEVLDRAECLRLLATVSLGRIVFSQRALPAILPVRFVLAGARVLLRTAAEGALAAATRDSVVAFEADRFDEESMSGWSVIGIGRTGAVRDEEEVAALSLPVWAPHRCDRLVAIQLEVVNGRRLLPVIG